MTDEYVLITGANGEIGQSLIEYLCSQNKKKVIALDLAEPCQELLKYCQQYIQGNILDQNLLQGLFDQYQFSVVYHLASILSSRAEKVPSLAQQVNVQGTFNLLELSVQQFNRTQRPVLFFYPSSIADGFPLLIWDLGSYYSFEVNTVNNAEGFVWTFYQNKKIVYDTWRESGGLLIEGTRYDTNYGDISKKFQEGLLTIQVRSKLRNGSWTEPSYLFVYLKPATQNNPSFNCPVPYPLPTPIVPDNQCGTGGFGDNSRFYIARS